MAVGTGKGWSKEECVQKVNFLDRYPVNIGQESAGLMIPQKAVERIFDFLQGKVERYRQGGGGRVGGRRGGS